MPFTLSKVDIPTFEQSSPWITAARQGMGLVGQGQDIYSRMLEQQKLMAELPYAGEMAKASSAYKTAMANYLSSPNQALKNLSPTGKTYVEPAVMQSIINQRNINRGNIPQNNMNIPSFYDQENIQRQPMSDIQSTYKALRQKQAYDPVLARQAQSAQIIYNQINDIDTKPLEKFSGIGGKLELMKERGKSALSSMGYNVKPSDEYRDYTSYMAVNKNAIMDAIRKALATSVVPKYVMSTLSPMVDPASPIWNDPQQVRQNIQTLKQWIKPYAGEQTKAMAEGVPTTLEESESRHRALTKELDKSRPTSAKEAIKQSAKEFKSQPIRMISKDGQEYDVPQEKVELFLKNEFKRK